MGMKIKFFALLDKSNLLSPTLFYRLKPTLILALLWNNFYSDSFLLSIEAKCLFYRFKQLCNNIPFCKIDIIWTKIKNVISGIICTHQYTFLSMNCIANFIAITIPEETRRHSWKQQTYQLLKCKAFRTSVWVKYTILGFFWPYPTGGLTANRPLTCIFFICLTMLGRHSGWLPLPKFNSFISSWLQQHFFNPCVPALPLVMTGIYLKKYYVTNEKFSLFLIAFLTGLENW